jgi:hypothetical protein
MNYKPNENQLFKKILITVFVPFLVILASNASCFSFENQPTPIKIEIKIEKEYYAPYKGGFFDPYYLACEKKSDSIKQKRYDIELTIKNTSSTSIFICLMNCSWEDNFIINNNYVSFTGINCDKNFLVLTEIKSGQNKVYQTTLARSIRFETDCCKDCINNDNEVKTTKLGLVIINDIFEKESDGVSNYRVLMKDKSSWREIVWSNPLYLLN